MARDYLRRSHVLVVCGHSVDETVKTTSPWRNVCGSPPPPWTASWRSKARGAQSEDGTMREEQKRADYYLNISRTLQEASIKMGLRSALGYVFTPEEQKP